MSDNKGVVYTKQWVADLILDIAGYTPDQDLLSKVIVEPSCGAGTFIAQIIDRLMESISHQSYQLQELLQPNRQESALYKCIIGYDLDKAAVKKTRKVATSKLISYGIDRKTAESIASTWIRQADFLLEEDIACDYIVGNPPYVRATDIVPEKRTLYCHRYDTVTKGCDLYVGFFQKGLESLKDENGVLCYICADRWMQNQYGKKLRAYINQYYHLDTIIKMHDVDAFEEAVSAYPAIVRIDKKRGDIKYVDAKAAFSEADAKKLISQFKAGNYNCECAAYASSTMRQPEGSSIIPLSSPATVHTVMDLMGKYPAMEDVGIKIGIGIATGKDDVFITRNADLVESNRVLPAFNMRDWRSGKGDYPCWLVNPWNTDGTLVDLTEYPKLKAYFEEHKDTLANRHVAAKNADSWYRTIDKVNWGLVGRPMLLFPDLAMRADPVYSDGSKYPCHNCYWLTSDEWELKALGGLLMSKTAESFIDALAVKMRGGTMRFQAQYLRHIHIPRWQDISEEVVTMLRDAFNTGNRDLANKAAILAYNMEE